MPQLISATRWLFVLVSISSVALAENNPSFGEPGADGTLTLSWEQLMPADYVPVWDPVAPLPTAPVIEELNGKIVRLPGYVIPLKFDGLLVKEFLLVPYFGACIHVPPPPSNQVVYVILDKEQELGGLFATVWVTGQMQTQVKTTEYAESGYTIAASLVEPFDY